ncbi:peptidylprolyl isomerase [Geothrix fermentans]|uniref:peptidylprolyl isomerase n=1 Tax=Geothrix fermentans TaxID=44676 RepID=UPI0004002A77|nr:peptidyl-prolyl cis-trans isomerase [Geothrix fermentans]
MSHEPHLRNGFTRMAVLLGALALGPALPAAPAKRPARTARTVDPMPERLKAIVKAEPGLSPEAAQAKSARLEKAWERATAKGLLKTPAWQESRQEGRLAVLGKAYLDTRPGHPGLTEAQVKAAFLAQGEERRVSHLLCKTREEAGAALKRIQSGEAFEQVAAEVSVDPSAAQNRGELGWIRQSQMVAAFGDPVFAAPVGALVGPLQSEFGWHVAKTWEARRATEAEFAARRDALLKEAAAAQMKMKREAALEALRPRYPLVPDLAVLGADRTTEALPGDEKKVAGRVAGAAISLRTLKRHMVDVLKTMGSSHSLGAATKARFMEGVADDIRLAAAARKQGLERRPEIQAALWLEERERAYARYAEAFLAEAQVAEGDLAKHHEAFPDRFREVGALRLQVLVADSKDQVDAALNSIHMGLPWKEAVTRHASAEATGNPEPGWVEVASLKTLVPPTLMQPLLAGPLGQPVGPMLGPDGYMIFNVLERRPGPVLPLAECRDAVRADYLKLHGLAMVDRSLED